MLYWVCLLALGLAARGEVDEEFGAGGVRTVRDKVGLKAILKPKKVATADKPEGPEDVPGLAVAAKVKAEEHPEGPEEVPDDGEEDRKRAVQSHQDDRVPPKDAAPAAQMKAHLDLGAEGEWVLKEPAKKEEKPKPKWVRDLEEKHRQSQMAFSANGVLHVASAKEETHSEKDAKDKKKKKVKKHHAGSGSAQTQFAAVNAAMRSVVAAMHHARWVILGGIVAALLTLLYRKFGERQKDAYGLLKHAPTGYGTSLDLP